VCFSEQSNVEGFFRVKMGLERLCLSLPYNTFLEKSFSVRTVRCFLHC